MALDAFRRAKIKRFQMVAWLTCLSLVLSLGGGIMVGERAKAQSLGNPAKASWRSRQEDVPDARRACSRAAGKHC